MSIEEQGLPTQDQVQAQFDAASEAGVSPCLWIPPKWQELQDGQNSGTKVLPDNSSDNELFNDPTVIDAWKNHIAECEGKKPPEGPERPPKDDTWPNPFADFSHVDDEEFSARSLDLVQGTIGAGSDADAMSSAVTTVAGMFKSKRAVIVGELNGDERLFEKALKVLQGDAFPKAGELGPVADLVADPNRPVCDLVMKVVGGHTDLFEGVVSALRGCGHGYDLLNRRDTVNKLKLLAGPGSPGMKRLALVFDWTLCRTTILMKDLNDALKRGEAAYNEARDTYINFLKDVDDHEPELKDKPLDVKNKKAPSGYGRALKWSCIDPVIFEGRIVGARAVVKWNPHSSSSGYPIPDPPK
jgi:hypothetical protein